MNGGVRTTCGPFVSYCFMPSVGDAFNYVYRKKRRGSCSSDHQDGGISSQEDNARLYNFNASSVGTDPPGNSLSVQTTTTVSASVSCNYFLDRWKYKKAVRARIVWRGLQGWLFGDFNADVNACWSVFCFKTLNENDFQTPFINTVDLSSPL